MNNFLFIPLNGNRGVVKNQFFVTLESIYASGIGVLIGMLCHKSCQGHSTEPPATLLQKFN